MTFSKIDLSDAIKKCAFKIEKFQQDGKLIGFKEAERLVETWLNNFRHFMDDSELFVMLIENISFISDECILDECRRFQEIHIDLSAHSVFYTCFGAETESSSRIMRLLNNQPNFAPNIDLLLAKIIDSNAPNPAIIFIDDFLNSGGQLSTILESWCTPSDHKSDKNNEISTRYNQRCFIGHTHLSVLKGCPLYFIYLKGMAKGIEKAKRTFTKLGLKGQPLVIETYSDDKGIFGTRDDINHIRNHLNVPVSSDSIFFGMSCDRISSFFEICEKAGYALLKKNKPDWSASRIENRLLGYGNSAKLFISQTNIPTCSLTCLWLGGHIEVNDKNIQWVPLIKRTEKRIGGTENSDDEAGRLGTVSRYTTTPLNSLSDIGNEPLDVADNASPPLDITVFTTAPASFQDLSPHHWRDVTQNYTDYLMPDIAEHLGLTVCSSRIFVKEMNNALFADINKLVVFCMDGTNIRGKIKSIHITTFGGFVSFLGIRFQFNQPGMTLKDAMEINFHLPINKTTSSKNPVLKVKNASISALFNWVISIAASGEKTVFPSDDAPIPRNFSENRFGTFTFVRTGSDIIETNKPLAKKVFHLLANFTRPEEAFLSKTPNYEMISFDLSASIGLSQNGAIVFCSGKINQNRSFLHEHFQRRYYFIYLLALHLAVLKRKISLQKGKNDRQALEITEWLTCFENLPFDSCCQKEYMNQFLKILIEKDVWR